MWEDLEIDPENIPTFKLVFHSLQIVCGFIGWCLEIAVFRDKDSKIVGNNGWAFAVVCCLASKTPFTGGLRTVRLTQRFLS